MVLATCDLILASDQNLFVLITQHYSLWHHIIFVTVGYFLLSVLPNEMWMYNRCNADDRDALREKHKGGSF